MQVRAVFRAHIKPHCEHNHSLIPFVELDIMPLHDETASASKSDPNPPSETSAATTQSSTAATASTSSTPQPRPPINIGTRRSALARIQTEIVEQALRAAWPDETYVVHAMSTTGDLNQQTPLHDFGAKSLWTHELEAGLLDGKLDLVVHSLKGGFVSLASYSTCSEKRLSLSEADHTLRDRHANTAPSNARNRRHTSTRRPTRRARH